MIEHERIDTLASSDSVAKSDVHQVAVAVAKRDRVKGAELVVNRIIVAIAKGYRSPLYTLLIPRRPCYVREFGKRRYAARAEDASNQQTLELLRGISQN